MSHSSLLDAYGRFQKSLRAKLYQGVLSPGSKHYETPCINIVWCDVNPEEQWLNQWGLVNNEELVYETRQSGCGQASGLIVIYESLLMSCLFWPPCWFLYHDPSLSPETWLLRWTQSLQIVLISSWEWGGGRCFDWQFQHTVSPPSPALGKGTVIFGRERQCAHLGGEVPEEVETAGT